MLRLFPRTLLVPVPVKGGGFEEKGYRLVGWARVKLFISIIGEP